MRRPSRRLAILAVLLLAGGCQNGCGSPEKLADIRLASGGTSLDVPISIDGVAGSMIFDTGSDATLLTPKAAERLDLTGTASLLRGSGLGGATTLRVVHTGSVKIGAGELDGVNMIVSDASRLNERLGTAWGLIGRDLLSYWDLELDLGHRRMALYRPQLCEAATPPWATSYQSFDTSGISANEPAAGDPMVIPLEVGSTTLQGMIDTGARRTTLDPASLGPGQVDAGSGRPASAFGVGSRTVRGRMVPFDDVAIGATKEAPIDLLLVALGQGRLGFDGITALIGTDLLSRHRVYLSFHAHRVFVSNGQD